MNSLFHRRRSMPMRNNSFAGSAVVIRSDGTPTGGNTDPACSSTDQAPPGSGPVPGHSTGQASSLDADGRRRGARVLTSANLRLAYWKNRRDVRGLIHLLAVAPRAAASAGRLWMTRYRSRRPVLVIALIEHIGDIVAAEPIARFARLRHPSHRVIWVTRHANRELVASFSGVDQVLVVRCLTEWMLVWSWGVADIVWDLHLRSRICETCHIPLAKDPTAPDDTRYFMFGNLLDVECLCAGLPKLADSPRFAPPTDVRLRVDHLNLPGRFFVIHCESSDPKKDWPADHWNDLIARVRERYGIAVAEIGSRPKVAGREGGPAVRNLCGTLSVVESAEVIRRAALFIGIDSGPAHLANAVGTQGVILVGDYRAFRHYMPYSGGYQTGELADIVYAPGVVAQLPVAAAFAAIQARLDRILPPTAAPLRDA